MPRYVYYCESCDSHFQIRHGMKEKQELCTLCRQTGNLTKVPQMPIIKTNPESNQEVGTLTKNYIEENRDLLNSMKKEARGNDYDI